MKSIIYVLLAVFTASILYTAIPQTNSQNQSITIQTTNSQFKAEHLESSAKIIESRLNDYGLKTAKSIIDNAEGTISIQLKGGETSQDLGYLLLAKGSIDFYETYNRRDVADALRANSELMKLLEIPQDEKAPGDYSSIVGFCRPNNIEAANKLIDQVAQKNGMAVKFAWSGVPYFEGQYVLHMLHQKSAIDKSYIENTEVTQDKRSEGYQLSITFNKNGTKLWSEITKSNISKNITITLDDRVLSSPKVMAQINGGRAMITGNFSENDLNLISALANNDNLPLNFTIKQ